MRGDLERVLYSKVKDDIEFRFNTTVQSFKQDTRAVHVKLSDGSTASFDLLIRATEFIHRSANWPLEKRGNSLAS